MAISLNKPQKIVWTIYLALWVFIGLYLVSGESNAWGQDVAEAFAYYGLLLFFLANNTWSEMAMSVFNMPQQIILTIYFALWIFVGAYAVSVDEGSKIVFVYLIIGWIPFSIAYFIWEDKKR